MSETRPTPRRQPDPPAIPEALEQQIGHLVNADVGPCPHCHEGGCDFCLGQIAHAAVALALAWQVEQIAELKRKVDIAEKKAEVIQSGYARLNLCSDHRDKANGTCICCQAERNMREAAATEEGSK